MRILVIEDDPEMGLLLSNWLREQGFQPELFENGLDGLNAFAAGAFDVAAIDVMLPGMTGFEVCHRIRQSGSTIPIVMITARDAVEDRVRGLDFGADDYIIKPFDFSELGARLRALFRRDAVGQKTLLQVGRVSIDSMATEVRVDGRRVTMSLKEFALLRLLAQSLGMTVTREVILREIWGSSEFIHPNIVEQYVSFVRHKLDPAEAGVSIKTIRGSGYSLELAR
ncbi:MAG TPA: response regulator transcription factor [Galbitalea sp.]|nr:response regulator transcription factor [Galbitalea sp.]